MDIMCMGQRTIGMDRFELVMGRETKQNFWIPTTL
jgi:hypothetical protein